MTCRILGLDLKLFCLVSGLWYFEHSLKVVPLVFYCRCFIPKFNQSQSCRKCRSNWPNYQLMLQYSSRRFHWKYIM